jgi:hypothetical protein
VVVAVAQAAGTLVGESQEPVVQPQDMVRDLQAHFRVAVGEMVEALLRVSAHMQALFHRLRPPAVPACDRY